jgi:TolB-like protein/DNA-binding winged helix-turn-helix (wHTH) protein/Tfp pilus assembly protein PilF
MSARLDSLVRFGAFQLDLRTGELRKSGVTINLPDQPFQLLKTLLERPGELFTREELRQRLWSAETFVDFEHGLNAAVRRLRDALGDSAEAPRFVETLPRRGYRFVAPVIQEPTADSAAPSRPGIAAEGGALPTPDVEPARPLTRVLVSGVIAAGAIAAVAVIAAAVLWAFGYRPWSPATRQSTSVGGRFMLAVLPFENLTGDPDQEYISDGMTEELIAQLGRMNPSRLGVIARTSAMQFKKTTKRADQIGSDLGVSYLLEGSVRTTGSRIRIAVQLIDARRESQLWAEQYERDARDLLALQREVAEAIVRQITTSLAVAPSHIGADAHRHSTVAEAYEHYLRGRYYWSKDTADRLQKAMEHFRRAIDLDPSYALAYSGVADTYTLLGSDGFLPMSEAYPLGRTAALKALELDDTLGEAHNSLAAVTADYYWDWAEADRHFKRAIALNPNYVTALRFYSFYLAYMGRPEEALAIAERARRVDPVSAEAQMNVGVILYFARRYDEALVEIRETLELAPDFGPAHIMLGRIYLATGTPDRAVEALERAQRIMGRRPDVLTPHASALARAGRQREARTMLAELRQLSSPRPAAPIRVALVHIALGETDRAFEWLDKACEARDWQMALLNVEPAFDVLRKDQRFAALVERVGLPR